MDEWVEDGQIRSKMLSLLETLDGKSAEAVDRLLTEFRELYTIYGAESCFQTLENLTEDCDQRTRILGSVFLLLCNRDSPKAHRAIENLNEGLMSEVVARRNFCLAWMFNVGCSGPASIPCLEPLLSIDVPIEQPDSVRSWAAACVLDANDGQGEHAFVVAAASRILRACTLHGDITSAIAAGRAFIKHGKLRDQRKALQTLLDLYDADERLDAKATLLGQIGKFEVDSPRVRKTLSEAALANSHPVSFRTLALHAIHQLNSSGSWVDRRVSKQSTQSRLHRSVWRRSNDCRQPLACRPLDRASGKHHRETWYWLPKAAMRVLAESRRGQVRSRPQRYT